MPEDNTPREEEEKKKPKKSSRYKKRAPKANSMRGRYPHTPKALLETATPFGRFVIDEVMRQGGTVWTFAKTARFEYKMFYRILRGESPVFSYQDLLRIAHALHVPAYQLFLLWFESSEQEAAQAVLLVQAFESVPVEVQREILDRMFVLVQTYAPFFPTQAQREESEQVKQLMLQYTKTGTSRKGDTPHLESQRNTGQQHGMFYRSPIDFRLYSNGWQEIEGLVDLMHDDTYPASDREDVLDMMLWREETPMGVTLDAQNASVVDDAREYLEYLKRQRA